MYLAQAKVLIGDKIRIVLLEIDDASWEAVVSGELTKFPLTGYVTDSQVLADYLARAGKK
jgi:hypothetical protein